MAKLTTEIRVTQQVVHVADGDAVIFSTDEAITPEMVDRLARQARMLFPTQKMMLLERGMKFNIVRKRVTRRTRYGLRGK